MDSKFSVRLLSSWPWKHILTCVSRLRGLFRYSDGKSESAAEDAPSDFLEPSSAVFLKSNNITSN